MNKYVIITVGIIIVVAAALIGISESGEKAGGKEGADSNATRERPESEKAAESDFDRFSDIELTDYDGNEVTLEQFRGQPLVINSWAVWCPFCKDELPDFAILQEEFEGEVTVIAIDRQEPLEKAKGFTDELGITDEMTWLLDSSDAFYRSIGGFSMPETIFVNGAGEIVVHKRGPMELEEMREHTQKLLNGN